MTLTAFSKTYLPAVEAEMQRVVAQTDIPFNQPLHEMLTYHMGWTGEKLLLPAQAPRFDREQKRHHVGGGRWWTVAQIAKHTGAMPSQINHRIRYHGTTGEDLLLPYKDKGT